MKCLAQHVYGNYSVFLLSVSSDHDSEGKRVQDMLSTIDKPQVGRNKALKSCTLLHTEADM